MPGQTQSFELNEEPHVATVGSLELRFKPEVYSDELLDAWAALRAVTLQRDEPGDDAAKIAKRTKEVNAATKQFLAELMLDESATAFLEAKLPDRVLLELQRWILGVYGLRPTGPSNGSSPPSPTETPGDDSTGSSPPVE